MSFALVYGRFQLTTFQVESILKTCSEIIAFTWTNYAYVFI